VCFRHRVTEKSKKVLHFSVTRCLCGEKKLRRAVSGILTFREACIPEKLPPVLTVLHVFR
jgi:hypothetical protein